jgi:cell wall-associated NlpC family hydrolase
MSEGRSEAYKPGMFFLAQIEGWTGRWVSAAQAFVRGGSSWTHAGLILDGDQFIEALPGGAKIRPLADLYARRPLLVSDAPIQRYLAARQVEPGDELMARMRVARTARTLEGVPYSFLDYASLAMAEWKLPGWQAVRHRVQTSQHLICSALVDRAYSWAGIHLYDDGRLPGDVTPGDLDRYDSAYRDDLLRRNRG